VAIARAILKNAPVILMDEATSALDSETERRIVETMESAFGDRTIVVIAHRIATVEEMRFSFFFSHFFFFFLEQIVNSDRIVVLGELGQVEDEGTHTELLARRGRYARLWDQQHAPPAPVAGKKD
jgi:ABC-type multidrug transport system fused ATPase/permease subunit